MIRVAIIGTGSIAAVHLKSYSLFTGRCRVVALVNPDMERAEALRDQFRLDCRVMQDYRELLQGGEVDLVSICTPPGSHAEIAVSCTQAGVHVLLEKPMAMSLEECDQILEAAEESGSILSVVGQNRFLDAHVRLKAALDSGLLGKIVHAQADAFWWRGNNYYDVPWRGRWETEGGGCTLNHGVHHIDLLLWMLGMPHTVQAVITNTSHDHSEVEDLSIAILSYPGGGLAQVTSSVIHHGEERQLIFQGERARVSVPWKVYASTPRDDGFPERNTGLEETIGQLHDSIEPLRYTAHDGQVDDILTAIEDKSGQVWIDGYEGRRTLELITAIYESSITGHPVSLPLPEDSMLYTRQGILANAPRFHRAVDKEEDRHASEI